MHQEIKRVSKVRKNNEGKDFVLVFNGIICNK
jgi:hypothetical protein